MEVSFEEPFAETDFSFVCTTSASFVQHPWSERMLICLAGAKPLRWDIRKYMPQPFLWAAFWRKTTANWDSGIRRLEPNGAEALWKYFSVAVFVQRFWFLGHVISLYNMAWYLTYWCCLALDKNRCNYFFSSNIKLHLTLSHVYCLVWMFCQHRFFLCLWIGRLAIFTSVTRCVFSSSHVLACSFIHAKWLK